MTNNELQLIINKIYWSLRAIESANPNVIEKKFLDAKKIYAKFKFKFAREKLSKKLFDKYLNFYLAKQAYINRKINYEKAQNNLQLIKARYASILDLKFWNIRKVSKIKKVIAKGKVNSMEEVLIKLKLQ